MPAAHLGEAGRGSALNPECCVGRAHGANGVEATKFHFIAFRPASRRPCDVAKRREGVARRTRGERRLRAEPQTMRAGADGICERGGCEKSTIEAASYAGARDE